MWKYLGVVAVAILLAMVSPLLAAADDGLILRSWFQWPIRVDLRFLPPTEMTMAALVMGGLAAQYLLIFLLVTPLRPLLRRLVKSVFRSLRRQLAH